MSASKRYDAIVIGAGHNGLVAGAYLARGGLDVLILEQRERVGGILAERRLGSGVKVPALVHTVGRLRSSIVRDLGLASRGLRLIAPDVRLVAPQPDGPAVTLWSDPHRTAEELRGSSAGVGAAYLRFDRRVRSIASFLAHVAVATPPAVDTPSLGDALTGLRMARLFRQLGDRAARETLRVLPMAVADLVGEAFQSDALRGAVAARAVRFTAMGPWTAGTAAALLSDSAGNDGGAAGQTVFAQGGPIALAEALATAARSFGAEIVTGAEVAAVTVQSGRARSVALATGREIAADAIVSAVDPKRTLLGLVDPEELGPTLVWRASNIRMPGATAKVNLALSGVPTFIGIDQERLHGRIVIAPGIDYLERGADAAKYGRVSEEPYLEATIPSLADPTLAPEGRQAMSIIVQWAPYRLRDGDWGAERERLGDTVVKTIESYAPGLSDLIIDREVLSPVDLETGFGLTGGHVLHGEPGLDQLFAWRPLLGFGRYRMPIPGLYLAGSGAHPGGDVTGAPGANAAREILADLRRQRR